MKKDTRKRVKNKERKYDWKTIKKGEREIKRSTKTRIWEKKRWMKESIRTRKRENECEISIIKREKENGSEKKNTRKK